MEPGEKIRQAREAKGWSQALLANRVGISQPAIKKIEDGVTTHSKFLPKIAQLLELDLSELDETLRPQLIPPIDAMPGIIPGAKLMGQVDFPVHASAEGGRGQIIISSDPVDFMPRPAPLVHVPNAYGLIITGTSMEPEYRHGDTALINPHLPSVSGEVHVFYAEREGSARATIKLLRRAKEEKWQVRQHNPPTDMPHDFELSRREWQWAHRVVGKYSRR